MEIRSAYSPHVRVSFDQSIPDPITGELQVSMTKQSFAEESEINKILAKYEKTGVIDHVKQHGGYEDMPAGLEYQTALQMTIDAQIAFDELPAQVRREFDNDAFKFLTFVEDPSNVERMGELGLLAKKPEPAPAEAKPPAEPPAEVAPEAAEKAAT